jgi:hypothetical protein
LFWRLGCGVDRGPLQPPRAWVAACQCKVFKVALPF